MKKNTLLAFALLLGAVLMVTMAGSVSAAAVKPRPAPPIAPPAPAPEPIISAS